MRRALELAVITVYFNLQDIPADKAQEWLGSNDQTPFFSSAVKKLTTTPMFAELESSVGWAESIKKLYWRLSDYVHCRGQDYSFDSLYSGTSCICGIWIGGIDKQVVDTILDRYIETVQQIAVILAAYNPILLFGLPIDEKFGLNPPASGIFSEGQSQRLRDVIPESYRSTLIKTATQDSNVQTHRQRIEDMPDLTEEDIRAQVVAAESAGGG